MHGMRERETEVIDAKVAKVATSQVHTDDTYIRTAPFVVQHTHAMRRTFLVESQQPIKDDLLCLAAAAAVVVVVVVVLAFSSVFVAAQTS